MFAMNGEESRAAVLQQLNKNVGIEFVGIHSIDL